MPAQAAGRPIDVPAGTVGRAAFEIGRQARVSIAVPDPRILSRRTPAIRGRNAGEALSRLARATGLRLQKVGDNSFVLTLATRPPTRTARPEAARTAQAPREALPEPVAADIIVTASKRDTLLSRFPGQLSQIPGDEFAALGVPGTEAIESRSVGFSSTHLGAGRNKLFIRGIADSSFSGPTQSPVGQYFGDMRTGYSGPDPDLKLVDMESVDILEGPQGTLYGSGALGGIVLLKPNMPLFTWHSGLIAAGASLTAHGDPGYDASAVLNLPFGDDAALRAVGYRIREGGYLDNLATGETNINHVAATGGRGILSVAVAREWAVDVTAVGQEILGDDSQYADEGLERSSLVDQPFSSVFALANIVVRKDSGALRFRSTTGATWQNVHENFDATLFIEPERLHQHSRGRAFSNETRLWRPMADGFSWLAGFTVVGSRYRVSRDVTTRGETTDLAGAENRVDETTVYGEAGIELTPRIEATAGARFTMTTVSGSGEHLSPVAILPDAKRSENRLLPSAAILARPADALTLYARYQQGFRPGGLSIAADTIELYRSDRLSTVELGFHYGRPRSGAFDLRGSATYSRWSDIQADFLDPSGLPLTDNIGDGRVWTLSLQGGARLMPKLRAEAGVAWNDGKITRLAEPFESLPVGDDGSLDIPNIARIVARAAVNWRTSLRGQWALEADAYARYVGRSRLGIGRFLGEEQGRYFDTGLALRASKGERAVYFSVSNLFDQLGNRFAFGAPVAAGSEQITPLRPRTIRIGLEQAF